MANSLKIVLASLSPRRKWLLEKLNLSYEAVDPGIVEDTKIDDPSQLVKENALRKAKAVVKTRKVGWSLALILLYSRTERS